MYHVICEDSKIINYGDQKSLQEGELCITFSQTASAFIWDFLFPIYFLKKIEKKKEKKIGKIRHLEFPTYQVNYLEGGQAWVLTN